jgi:hypothetical protein
VQAFASLIWQCAKLWMPLLKPFLAFPAQFQQEVHSYGLPQVQ